MRFFLERNSIDKGEDLKIPLSIDQTQNLINTANSLLDKELARYQRRSFVIPIWVAILTALVTVFVTLRKEKADEKKTIRIQQQFDTQNLKIDELSQSLKEIEIQLDTTTKSILKKIK